MMKANSRSVVKVDSLTFIKPYQTKKPEKGNNTIVVKSLEECASKILCRDNNKYVKSIANSDDETKRRFKRTETHGSKKYVMKEASYKPTKDHTSASVDIGHFTPQQQRKKIQEQLFLHVSDFMIDKIATLQKKQKRKLQIQTT